MAVGGSSLFVYMLTLLVVVRLCTMYEIPSSALAPELDDAYRRRPRCLVSILWSSWPPAYSGGADEEPRLRRHLRRGGGHSSHS